MTAVARLQGIALGLAAAIALPAAAAAQQLWSVEDVAAPREVSEGQAVAKSPISRGEYTDCRPTTAPLVFDGGYQVSMCYETAEGTVGEAQAGIWASGQSGLLWFFDRDNAEVLVKVLNGCSHNGRRWVFVAPVTDVAFNLHVTSISGRQWTHRNPLGETAATRSDTSAFVCADDDATKHRRSHRLAAEIVTGQAVVKSPISRGEYTDCRPTTTPLVFDGAYQVSLCYETADGKVGEARGGIWASNQSGLLWFFSRGNAEVLVKVLDGCSHNGSRWIFVAPVTDVAFNLHVTSIGDRKWTHSNRLGETAVTRSDTSAFDCATEDGVLETVSVSSASAEEGEEVEFTVTQSGPARSDTVLNWSTAGGTATSGEDFTAVTAGTLRIAAGETAATLRVSTVEDALAEANETFTVTLTGTMLPPGVTLGTAIATGTVVDDDMATVSVSSASAEEGDAVEFTVTQSGPARSDTVLNWSTAGGTATSGEDFTAVTAGTLRIAAGETAATLRVSTVEDALAEANETFTVTLTGTMLPPGVTLGTAMATGTVVDDDAEPVYVDIPDVNLRSAIENALGLPAGAPITQAHLESLATLEAQGGPDTGISDLKGLEFAVNLTRLDLAFNNIADVSPLVGLTDLTELVLGHNYIGDEDLSLLASLTNLTELQLWGNSITDVSPLADLPNLSTLYLNGNFIADVSSMASFTKLTFLSLAGNGVTDVSPLASLTELTELHLGVNSIEDIAPLADLPNLRRLDLARMRGSAFTGVSALASFTNLTHLWLGGNSVADVSPLASLTNLRDLELWENEVADVTPLAGLTNLEMLNLSWNDIADLSPLAGLANLRVLELYENKLADVTPLASLTNLTELQLGFNSITDVSPLADLTNLRVLKLPETEVAVSALAGFTNLTWLGFEANGIADVSLLAGLTNLRSLYLGYNDIEDVSPLADLTNLSVLHLQANYIEDVSSLAGLTNLSVLNLQANPLDQMSQAVHIPALREKGVRVHFDSFVKGEYDIQFVFQADIRVHQQRAVEWAMRRWTEIVQGDVPDYVFDQRWSGTCGGDSYEIAAGERIDDLRVYVNALGARTDDPLGRGGPSLLRDSGFPIIGCLEVDFDRANVVVAARHEMGHVLGIGTLWDEFVKILNGELHMSGPLAVAAFDDAGGTGYAGAKVPLNDPGHWRVPVLDGELMGPFGGYALSAITVQALADLGYGVGVSQADDYTLPGAASAKSEVGAAGEFETGVRERGRLLGTPPGDGGFGVDRRSWLAGDGAGPAPFCGVTGPGKPIPVAGRSLSEAVPVVGTSERASAPVPLPARGWLRP